MSKALVPSSARQGVNAEQYLKSHFQEVLGKVYRPFAEPDIYSLARYMLARTQDKRPHGETKSGKLSEQTFKDGYRADLRSMP